MWPRWMRALASLWVALDCKKREGNKIFWFLLVFILGPLTLPFYMSLRPLRSGEIKKGCFLWNLIVNAEYLISWLVTIAGSAVMIENLTTEQTKDIAPVKVAEIKAGTILGALFFAIVFIVEKIGFAIIRKKIEK